MKLPSKYNFGFDVAGLTAWVNETDTELLLQLQAANGVAPWATIKTGIKGTQRLHFTDESETFQTDGCSYNASGTTTLTEKDITVGKIKLQKDICIKDLNGFWTEQVVQATAKGEEVVPEEIMKAFMMKRLNKIANLISVADWQGDTDSVTANLNKYDGLLKEIFADGSVIDGNTSDATGATTVSTILARMQDMYLQISEDMVSQSEAGEADLIWFLPYSYYKQYIIAGRNANLFHHNIEEGFGTYHGTKIQLAPQTGLASQEKMIITTKGNIVLGVDGEGDEDALEVWYSQDDRIHKSHVAFKRGVTYKFSEQIVKWGLGAS